MERKNYTAIAEEMRKALAQAETTADRWQWARCAEAIARAMRADYPKYSKPKFMNACGWAEAFGKDYYNAADDK